MLKKLWQQFCMPYSPEAAEDCWQELQACYTAPERYYHNLGHIGLMLKFFVQQLAQIHHPELLFWAICYHDSVYDVRRNDNEAQSAQLAQRRLAQLGVAPEVIEGGFQAILATAHRQGNQTISSDMAWLLDCDLAVLGLSESLYQGYARAIRKEYGHLADEIYREGRSGVLNSFLAQPRIYKTDWGFQRFEAQARINLQHELKGLASLR